MTRTAFFDCFSGISGDMVLGALVDCGLPVPALEAELRGLALDGWRIRAEEVRTGGLRATRLQVEAEEAGQPTRRLHDIHALLDASSLHPDDREAAGRIFERLARAEAGVHGVPLEEVRFHEVGAIDSIIDVVGAIAGLRLLGVEQLYCSALPVSTGEIQGAHGPIPRPGPATLALLAEVKAPLLPLDVAAELVTPTGAAIVSDLARFRTPAMRLERAGYGAGARDLAGRPNVLRVWLGETREDGGFGVRSMSVLETNVDDMTAEQAAYAQSRLLEAGAADAWLTPILMKKGRPALLFSVLCRLEDEERLRHCLFSETGTLGVRAFHVQRHEAERRSASFESSLGPAAVKVRTIPGRVPVVAPEFEVCRLLAQKHGLPLAEVYRIVQAEAIAYLGGMGADGG